MGNSCIDCGRSRVSVVVSHSLQCEDCQKVLFSRLRSVAGRYLGKGVDAEMLKNVKGELDRGLTGYAISRKYGYNERKVYHIIGKLEKGYYEGVI